jgi:putative ABC transport system substrate-binding protein
VLSHATSTIPVIFVGAADPERVGLIGTLARPAGDVTGFADNASALSAKRLQILKEAVPTASRIAILWNAKDSAMTLRYREIDRAAQGLGVSIQPLGVGAPDDFEHAFEAMVRDRPDALFMVTDALTNLNRRRVLDFAESQRLPAMYEFASFVREGGLMSYGARIDDMYVHAAGYIDKIFKGVKPGDLPVELPTRYDLVINLKSATAVGLTIPQALLLRADEVIQ